MDKVPALVLFALLVMLVSFLLSWLTNLAGFDLPRQALLLISALLVAYFMKT